MPKSQVLDLPPIDDDLLTAPEAAARLGYTLDGIYVNRHRGLLPGRLGVVYRNRLWFREIDVERYLHERLTDAFEERWLTRHEAWPSSGDYPITEARRLLNERQRLIPPDEVEDWLRDLLSAGPISRARVLSRAERAGYYERAIDKAAKQLGVVSTRDESRHGRPSTWSLPEPEDSDE